MNYLLVNCRLKSAFKVKRRAWVARARDRLGGAARRGAERAEAVTLTGVHSLESKRGGGAPMPRVANGYENHVFVQFRNRTCIYCYNLKQIISPSWFVGYDSAAFFLESKTT